MLTGNRLLNTPVDELNELGLPNMAAELDRFYASPGFLETDHLTLISELISPGYKDKISKRINNRPRSAKLIGSPAEIGNCTDSKERRSEKQKSTIICSQRTPENWKPMIMNDEISANSIVKRATKHYTVMINRR